MADDATEFAEDDLDTLDDFDDDSGLDDESDFDVSPENSDDDAVEPTLSKAEEEARRIKARREIERRNELKALKSELDEWDDLLDVDL
jgi:hypothetical protein